MMNASGLFYVRFMDDILVLAPTRWKLRRAVGLVNQILGALRLEKHPGKTFIGRIERGFDFPGYRFSREGLGLETCYAACDDPSWPWISYPSEPKVYLMAIT
jgi:hypothetical protein